jgi:predicted nuclease of predicted toxin-antitoxin system
MLRMLIDENVNQDLIRGVLRRRPGFDLVSANNVGLSESTDMEILDWAVRQQRVVLTHDVNTMTRFAIERIKRGEPMGGIFIVHQESGSLSTIIDDLLLLDECSDTAEWSAQIIYLPLR